METPTPSLPRHVGIIMDGNGRWARGRGKPVTQGHRAGVEAIRRVLYACDDLGIHILSVYAFSTENWRRSRREVQGLMRLFEQTVEKEFDEIHSRGIRILVSGRREGLSPRLAGQLADAVARTRENRRGTLNLCLNYGGRLEIVDAARRLLEDGTPPELIDEAAISARLYAPDLPDPDLIIRTAGESRASNFLLWQSAYSEFHVTSTLWPDFTREDLEIAIADFLGRTRRFGARPEAAR